MVYRSDGMKRIFGVMYTIKAVVRMMPPFGGARWLNLQQQSTANSGCTWIGESALKMINSNNSNVDTF